jgi:hypothetical protein
MLTDQQRTYFDEMEKMFNTQGWKLFIDDLKGNQEAIKESILSQVDMEKFFTCKGRYQTLHDVINLRNFLETARKSLEDQEDGGLHAIV